MKKFFLKIIQSRNMLTVGMVGILLLTLFSSIFLNVAFGADTQQGLVQCNEQNPASCSLCALFLTIKAVYDFASRVTLVLAIAYTLWGGYEIMISGAQPALYASGKKRILNAFKGVFIVLAAWFMVNAFIVGLTGSGTVYTYPWNELQCK